MTKYKTIKVGNLDDVFSTRSRRPDYLLDVVVVVWMHAPTGAAVAVYRPYWNAGTVAVFAQPVLRHCATKTHEVPLHLIYTRNKIIH